MNWMSKKKLTIFLHCVLMPKIIVDMSPLHHLHP